MSHGPARKTDGRRLRIAITGILLFPMLATWVFAQEPGKSKSEVKSPGDRISGATHQPANNEAEKLDHKALLEMVRKQPLRQMALRKPDNSDLSASEKADIETAQKAMDEARAAREKQDYTTAAASARKALDIRRRILGREHFLTVNSELLSRLLGGISSASASRKEKFTQADKDFAEAEKLYDEGEYAKALTAAKKALQAREDLLSEDHQMVAEALRTVGKCQIELRFFEEAQANLEKALTIAESSCGKGHPEVALVLDRLGWLQINQKRYAQAETSFRRATHLLGTTVGETVELAEALDNLGTAEFYVRQINGALRDKLRALVIRETLLGPDDAETGVSYSNLAWLYTQIGLPEEVIPLRLKAREVLTKALGKDHPWVFLEISNLARFYEATNNFEEAAKLREEMVAHDKKSGDPLNARAVSRLRDLAFLYLRTERIEEGLRTMTEARQHAMEIFKRGHTEPASEEMMAIANVYERAFRMFDAAKETLAELYAAERASGAKPDENMLRRWSRLANLWAETGESREAETLLKEIIRLTEKDIKENQLPLAAPLLMLARVQRDLGENLKAADTIERLLQISETWLPPTAPGKVFALAESARVNTKLGMYDMAKFALDEAQRIAEIKENRQREPQAFVEAQRAWGDYYDALGQHKEAVAARQAALDEIRPVIQISPTLFLKGRLAEEIKELLDSDDGKVLDNADRAKLKTELKELLTELEKYHALNAENKEWIKQLD